ncbi:tRNA (N6-threonylcarbamoyladenosine(37)-N6)-methyltransferase TrmO [Clostridia bacterium OttesenSCG-928-O13]|nr:tRNA (N6-threonylcarbamoyladenosine(37)-N6)-methyltransferase TrmO [Clostridia bacterium OttesenSCG-928-O13]
MDTLKTIARMHSDFPAKFGIPRQSSLVKGLRSAIVFEPEYRSWEAVRGLEDFSHLWLIWGFSQVGADEWSPTVRPPRLGGNARMGVFATRSPYRPNPMGLSSVEMAGIEKHPQWGPVIVVLGADLMDKTPIYDIKPYLPFVDSHPDARAGFASRPPAPVLQVEILPACSALLPQKVEQTLKEVLAQDPRPSYQRDAGRVYGMEFAGFEVKFSVDGEVLRVCEVAKREQGETNLP